MQFILSVAALLATHPVYVPTELRLSCDESGLRVPRSDCQHVMIQAIKFCGDCKTGTIKTKFAAWKCGECGGRNFLDESEVGRPALAQKPPALSSSHGSPAVRLRWVEDEA